MNKKFATVRTTWNVINAIAKYTEAPVVFGERSNYLIARPEPVIDFMSGIHVLLGNDHLVFLATPTSWFPLNVALISLLTCMQSTETADCRDFSAVFLNPSVAICYVESSFMDTSSFFLKLLGDTADMLPVVFEPKGGEC